MGIIQNCIIQNQQKEHDQNTQQWTEKSTDEIIQPGAAKYIVVKTREIVQQDPCNGKTESAYPETGIKCDGDFCPKYLGLNLNLSIEKKENPGRHGSQEVK